MNGNDQELAAFKEREKFVSAFNETMLKIWKEQMTLLDVIDTGALLASPKSLPIRADGQFIELGLSQSFWSTDFGRTLVRVRRHREGTRGIWDAKRCDKRNRGFRGSIMLRS